LRAICRYNRSCLSSDPNEYEVAQPTADSWILIPDPDSIVCVKLIFRSLRLLSAKSRPLVEKLDVAWLANSILSTFIFRLWNDGIMLPRL